MDKTEYFEKAAQHIIDANEDAAVQLAQKYLDEGLDPVEMIEKGLSEGIRKLGDLFDRGEIFLPHLIIASEAMTGAVKVLEQAGAAALQNQHGSSLRPLIDDPGADRAFALNEWDVHAQRTGVGLSLRTVRTRTHKVTLEMQSGAGELYDLVNDPHEMTNLFDDPAAAGIRAELTAHLETRPDDMRDLREPVGMA